MKPSKRSALHIFNSITPCLPMSGIYLEFEFFVRAIMQEVYKFNYSGDMKTDIKKFLSLSISSHSNYEHMIEGNSENIGYTVLLSTLGISREQMKNIVFAYHPLFNNEKISKPSPKKVLSDPTLTDNLAYLLMHGDEDDDLRGILAGDVITLKRFNLAKCKSLFDVVKEPSRLQRDLEDTFKSRMQNKKGYSAETSILAGVVEKVGLKHEAGEVPVLAQFFDRTSEGDDLIERNPRVDLVIPSLANPRVLIESTYNLTTASGQTKKIDANDSLYRAIKKYEQSIGKPVIFINFVDGAGWAKRGLADVSRLVSSCDYAVNYENLDLLEEVLKYFKNELK